MKTRFSEVKYLDRNDIIIRPSIFQNRNGDFSQASVEKIVREGFDVSQEPIVVWFDAGVGKYVVLSGHSRFEASRQLFESGAQPELAQMPVREFLGDFDEAVYFANVESNRQGEAETLLGDLRAFERAKAENCKSKECLQGLFKSGARIKRLQDLSHLNLKGRFLEELDKDSTGIYPNLELYARWTGNLREIYPQISDSHENEIFSWLYAGKDGGTNFLPTKEDFMRLIENRVGNFGFNPDEPLNLKNTVRKTTYELNANEQIAELNKDIKALEMRNVQLNTLMQKGLEQEKETRKLPKNFEEWETEQTRNNRAINKKKLQINDIQDKVKTLNVRDLDLFALPAPDTKKTEKQEALPTQTPEGTLSMVFGEGEITEADLFDCFKQYAELENFINFTKANFRQTFEADAKGVGKVTSKIGEEIIFNDRVYEKLDTRGTRKMLLGTIRPTLENPILVVKGKEGNYLYFKSFKKPNDERFMVMLSVSTEKEGKIVSASSYEVPFYKVVKEANEGVIAFYLCLQEALPTFGTSGDPSPKEPANNSISEGKDTNKNQTSKETQEKNTPLGQGAFIAKIQANIAECEQGEGKPYNKTQRGKIGAELGITAQKEVKELTELAIVMYAREIATREGLSLPEKYAKIVSIYECQPVISEQDSTSKAAQQYSTPIPIAFLSGEFTKTPQTQSVFEPSAGNGLLTVAYPTAMVSVNELDKERLESLEMQDFAGVTTYNGAEPFPTSWAKTFDAVLTNPPFGTTNKVKAGNYELTGLEHIMAHYALQTMKDTGRCAIIIGGHSKYDDKGRPTQGKERSFFYYLYTYYNVLDVINIDGSKLYRSQGTSFDICLILIDGRKENPKFALPTVQDTVIETFEDLLNRVTPYLYDKNLFQSRLDTNLLAGNGLGNGNPQTSRDTDSRGTRAVLEGREADAFDSGSQSTESELGEPTERNIGDNRQQSSKTRPNSERDSELGDGATPYRTDESGENVFGAGQKGRQQGHRNTLTETSGGNLSPNNFGTNDDQPEAKLRLLSNQLTMAEAKEEAGLKPYKPASKNTAGEAVLIPTSMETEAYQAMARMRKEVGDTDTFVAKKLNYSLKELYEALSNYQIDSVALAIWNIKKGGALIIGDQTGVGKGRQAAAIIRYAREQGVAPIFLTQTVDLFSDMLRDLKDIGCDYTPFILNADEKIVDKEGDGKVLFRAMGNQARTNFITQDDADVEKSGTRARTDMVAERYDFIVATYSQFNNKKLADKINFLYKQAHGNVLILDESHNAGGEGTTSQVIQHAVSLAKGCTFLSATFAKRPDNMPVYAVKTVLSEANLTKEKLVEAVMKGGVAMQEVIASQLVKAGQMLRRERSFEGASVSYVILGAEDERIAKQHAEMADRVTEIVRDIIAFQREYVTPIVEQMDEEAAKDGKETEVRKGTSQAGVDNTPYFSRIFNVINQMLFGIKAKEVAKLAQKLVKEGKSVVIAFNSTMEAMLTSLGLNEGDVVENPDFAVVLQKGLDSVMKITEVSVEGLRTYKNIPVSDLGAVGQMEYESIQQKIREASTGISLSPIDIFVHELQKAGLRVGEMTGRKEMLRFASNGAGIIEKRRDRNKNEITRKFNAGELDVVLLNRSAATGISLHSSKKFVNQKRRAMIIAQPQLDINNEVQMRGRVHRVGQVVPPEYYYVSSIIPAEQRLVMMLKRKLKSLDANTTSNQKNSAEKVLESDDFLNKYGDRVVWQYLIDNPELNAKLGDPIAVASIENEKTVPENSAQKVTGRVAILSTKEQEKFYKEVLTSYNDYVQMLMQQDEYDLEIQVLPLDVELRAKRVAVVGNGGRSDFGQDSILGLYDTVVLEKPYKLQELKDKIADALEGTTAEALQARLLAQHGEYVEERLVIIKKETKAKVAKDLELAIAKERKKLGVEELEGEPLEALKNEHKNILEALLEDKTNKFQSDQKWLHDLFKLFQVGKAVNVPTDLTGESGSTKLSTGIFLGFELSEDAKNPFVRSKVKARFAVNDGRRFLAIPMSQTKQLSAISSRSYALGDDETETYIKNWEKSKSNNARENRHILTGNVLQGFDTFRGRFVDFSLKSGENQKGILMPEGWADEEKDKAGKPTGAGQLVKVPIGKALAVIKGLTNGQSIATADGLVGIQRTPKGFTIMVPQSKQKGGDYYLDSDLLNITGSFEKYANEMRANVSEDDIDFVVGILQKKFQQSVEISADKLGDIPTADIKADIEDVTTLPTDYQDESENLELLPTDAVPTGKNVNASPAQTTLPKLDVGTHEELLRAFEDEVPEDWKGNVLKERKARNVIRRYFDKNEQLDNKVAQYFDFLKSPNSKKDTLPAQTTAPEPTMQEKLQALQRLHKINKNPEIKGYIDAFKRLLKLKQ